jgi:hypothetical protein
VFHRSLKPKPTYPRLVVARPTRPCVLSCKAATSGIQGFEALAKVVTGQLASELAGDEEAYSKLQSWYVWVHGCVIGHVLPLFN